ncbi:UNVERIFIED_CONTAM: hypothetical protein Slati_2906100 [Sesamum latifolium]|uniref:Uncharacterized protein n=1 Tax=Sesamum latifolium TaxID=2727402 RepID=A0AAW2VDK4_9LAMI
MHPDALLHQISKQRYFLGSNFFDATTGSSPSYTWCSLLRSRELLATGVRWRIGDEQAATIEGHPWFPRAHLFQLIAKPKTLLNWAKVPELITPEKDGRKTSFCLNSYQWT